MEIKKLKLKETERQSFNQKVVVICVGIIAVLVILGGGTYYILNRMGYIQALKMAVQYQKQVALNKADQQILAQLKKIILLPDDVAPTMAVINNIDALKKQQPGFFANAKNNDRLIIYPDMAIIFDIGANKIIKVGPVQTANTTETLPK